MARPRQVGAHRGHAGTVRQDPVDVTKSAAVQSKTTTQAKVDDVGVSLLDDTHAEVLAFLTVSVENDGVAMGSSSGPELIHMQKVGDKWLLSEVVLQ